MHSPRHGGEPQDESIGADRSFRGPPIKTAYILHGCCEEDEYLDAAKASPSNSDWLPWLQKQLLLNSYLCQTPEMPSPHRADYDAWKSAFPSRLDERTTLVAHSCGCGFVLRLLGDVEVRIARLVLVAPWLDLRGARGDFLDFSLDPTLAGRIGDMHALYALDDRIDEVKDTVAVLAKTYPRLVVHAFATGGHFSAKELGADCFPALLDIVTGAETAEPHEGREPAEA